MQYLGNCRAACLHGEILLAVPHIMLMLEPTFTIQLLVIDAGLRELLGQVQGLFQSLPDCLCTCDRFFSSSRLDMSSGLEGQA